MNAVSDLEQRQAALDPAESFIVQAPAGSGKTELLIQRYLRLLSLADRPEEILAITFTRKAAAEMRGRVLDALEQVVNQQAAADDAEEITLKLAADVIARDSKEGWQLAENPTRMRIQTIDSLTASLTRQMPILSDFGAQPEIIENANELYRLAAVNTLAGLEGGEGWSDAIAVLLEHLDNNLPRVRDMLATMLARRDQWLRHVVEKPSRELLEAGLAHLVESVLAQTGQCFPPALREELLTLVRYAAANLQDEGSDSGITSCADIDVMPGTGKEDLIRWQAITDLLFTKAGTWRKSVNVKTGFPAAGGSSTESEHRSAMKSRFAALTAGLSADEELTRWLLEVKQLPAASYSDSEWLIVDALYQLLVLADAQLRLLFAERNQMDFGGITQAAIQALGALDEPSELAMQLDYQLKHILVDEFQDISINQFLLLERLTAGWSGDDQHSLFLVGDPMQSIYRFREAEVGLFLNTWERERLNQVPLTPLNITVNFRSEPGIVEWVNQSFELVLPALPNIASGAVHYVSADAFHPRHVTHPVQIHPLPGRDDGHEAELVLQLVKEARLSQPQGSIAILVRNRSHLTEIVSVLARVGVPYRAVEIEAMGQRAAIQDLLALTLALTHLADRVAWLAVLRAPWCGLTLAELHHLVAGSQASVWECLLDARDGQLHRMDGQQRLSRLLDVVERALASRGRKPLHRWIESVWLSIGGPACLEHESDLENARAFFQLLEEFDSGGDLREREVFCERVAALYAVPDISSDDVVQIMTIHKAKGLEFDCVILPGLSRSSGADETRLLLWMETPHGTHQDLLLAPVQEAGKPESMIYSYLKRLESEKQSYELGRLMYVAATRAKKHLHIIATAEIGQQDDETGVRTPHRGSLLAQLWPAVKDIFDDTVSTDHEESGMTVAAAGNNRPGLRRLSAEWKPVDKPEALGWQAGENEAPAETGSTLIEFEWAGETIMHVGTVVHRCIQWLSGQEFTSWNEEKISQTRSFREALLRRLGVKEDAVAEASREVEKALLNMLQDARCRWLFSGGHSEARNEYAVSGLHNGRVVNVVLDRTFVDSDGVRWIVDYKTSRHEGTDREAFLDQQQQRYREQLEKYGMLVRSMDDRPTKLGLYFPLLQGWREWSLA